MDAYEGWAADPFGGHEVRYFVDGRPTKLVRDGSVEIFDDLPLKSNWPSTPPTTEPPVPGPSSEPEPVEPVFGSVSEPEPVLEPVFEPVSESEPEPEPVEPVFGSVSEPEPVLEPVFEPVSESEPEPEPVEPVFGSVFEPVFESVSEPEPVFERPLEQAESLASEPAAAAGPATPACGNLVLGAATSARVAGGGTRRVSVGRHRAL